MHPVCRKYWSAIVSTWLSSGRWENETRRRTQLKIEWHFSKSRRFATSIFARASPSCPAWLCTETAWKDCGDPIKVQLPTNNLSSQAPNSSYDTDNAVIFSTFAYSAQPAGAGVSRDSGPNDGLRYRAAAAAQVDQVALEVVRDDDHVPAALQWQPLAELQQESRLASSQVALRRGWASQQWIIDAR